MLLDTCFLIDLHREAKKNLPGDASIFLTDHAETKFHISAITVTEYLEGFPDQREGEKRIALFPWLDIDAGTARVAAKIRRTLRKEGKLIGDFDILIAATAIANGLPLVTNNADHFNRISALEVVNYRPSN